MSNTDLAALRDDIVQTPKNYDTAVTITIACEVEGDDGEKHVLPAATGRLTSISFTIDFDGNSFDGVVKEGVRRLEALREAGIFASKDTASEFPGVDPETIHFSIHLSL